MKLDVGVKFIAEVFIHNNQSVGTNGISINGQISQKENALHIYSEGKG